MSLELSTYLLRVSKRPVYVYINYICNIIGITHIFSFINILPSPRKVFDHKAIRLSVQTPSTDLASVSAKQHTGVVVILAYFTRFQP